MDIREYFRIFRRWWTVIVGATVAGVGLGFLTTFPFVNQYLPGMFSTEYQSQATLFVATQNGTSVSEAYQNSQFSMDRAVSYAGLATSDQVAQRAVDQLKEPISAGELRAKVSAAPRPKTVLLDVTVQDPDAAKAQTYANAVADQLVGLVSELETSRRGGTPAAGVVVVDEADYPTEQMGLSLSKRLLIGAFLGLLLGLIAAIVVGVADRRLRSRDAVEQTLDSLVLGSLPADSGRPEIDVVDLGGEGLYAEKIRELRTSLRFTVPAGHDAPPRIIAITSPSAADGRTTTAIDLAAALAESGRSVVLVDADMRHSAIADRLPLNDVMRQGAAERGLSTVLAGENELVEALIADVEAGTHTITVLPAGPRPPRPGELWATDHAVAVMGELARYFEYVVIDTPPVGTYNDAGIVAALCDGAVVLARVHHTTGSALRQALQALQSANADLIGTVVTCEPVGVLRQWRRRKQVERDLADADADADADAAADADAGAAADYDADADTTRVNGSDRNGNLVESSGSTPPRARHGRD